MSNVPWFTVGVLCSLAAGLLGGAPLSRAIGVPPALAVALLVAIGIVLSATLTPHRLALEGGALGTGTCDFSRLGLAPVDKLASVNDTSLNILLFVPLGFTIALFPRSRMMGIAVIAALVLPFAIETVQLLVPHLARGCQSSDVTDNLTGLAVGLLGGSAFQVVGPNGRRL